MRRRITGFGLDEAGDRYAWLECGHRQHVRHQPPFINRPWTQTEAGRSSKLGEELNCVRCDAPDQVWFSLDAGDALTAEGEIAAAMARFGPVFGAAGEPWGLALLKRHDTEHSLQCSVTLYLSPAAEEVATALGAAPCSRPSPTNLEEVMAAPGWRELLFPRNL